jgi:hydroxyacylglutathione hydrolase
MNKVVKRSIIAVAVVVFLVACALGVMIYRFIGETKKMAPLATGKVVNGIYAVKDDFVNLYVIRAGEGFVVIDGANDAENVRTELKKLDIDPAKVRAVFLTHTDNDHVAAVKLFPSAKVFIGKNEEQMVNGTAVRMFVFHNSLERAYEPIEDGQVVTVGDAKIRAIATPGHTPGSTSYLVNDAYLFTGDTMGLRDGVATQFNELFNMDTATQLVTIKTRIASLQGVKYIFTAHHGTSDDFNRTMRGWKK